MSSWIGIRGKNCDTQEPGTVAYYGIIPETKSDKPYIGFIYDEEFGKYDGCYQGTRYFTCEPNHGAFLKPRKIILGISIIEAIEKKYVKNEKDNINQITSTCDNIVEIKFIGESKIADRKSRVEELDEMGFENESVCAVYPCNLANLNNGKCLCGKCIEKLKNMCKSLKILDLSNTLIISPFVLVELFYQLNKLESINVSSCAINWENLLVGYTDSNSSDPRKIISSLQRKIVIHNNMNKKLVQKDLHTIIKVLNPSEIYIDECTKLVFKQENDENPCNNNNDNDNNDSTLYKLTALSVAHLDEPIDLIYFFKNIVLKYDSLQGIVLSKNTFVGQNEVSLFMPILELNKNEKGNESQTVFKNITFLSFQHTQIDLNDLILFQILFPNLDTLNLGMVCDREQSNPYIYTDSELIWIAVSIFSRYKYRKSKKELINRYSASPLVLTHVNYREVSKSIVKDGQRYFAYKCMGKSNEEFLAFISNKYNYDTLQYIMMEQQLSFTNKIRNDFAFKNKTVTKFFLEFVPKENNQPVQNVTANNGFYKDFVSNDITIEAKSKSILFTEELWAKFENLKYDENNDERPPEKFIQKCLQYLRDTYNLNQKQVGAICSILAVSTEINKEEDFADGNPEVDEAIIDYNQRYFCLTIDEDNENETVNENDEKFAKNDEEPKKKFTVELPKSITIMRLVDYVLKYKNISPKDYYKSNSHYWIKLCIPPNMAENTRTMKQNAIISDMTDGTECIATLMNYSN